MSFKKFNLLNDVYYSKEYLSLYLKTNESIFEFKIIDGENIFYNIAIKRQILNIGNMTIYDGYFDLETPYGYGGFYTNNNDNKFIEIAMQKYIEKCKSEKIIAEFIRFHPFNDFPVINTNFFDMNIYDRNVVYIDLTLSRDERWKNYSTKTRNILRKCERELTFVRSDNIEKFIELYEKTMDKNNASEFYYFPKSYFEKLMKNKDIELYEIQKDGVVISSAFFMFSDEFGHYHLSANDYEMRQYNANYFILDKIFDVAEKKQKKYFILGGGTTGFKDDSLLKFKQKFSNLTKPFYISGKIYNEEIYNRYRDVWEQQTKLNIQYFLKYRLEP